MSVVRAHVHEHSAFNTPPHFAHSRGTEAKFIFHAVGENWALFKLHSLGCSQRARCEVAHVTHVTKM